MNPDLMFAALASLSDDISIRRRDFDGSWYVDMRGVEIKHMWRDER